MTHHHLEGFAEAVLRAGGDHNIRVVPDPGVRLVNCLLEVTKLLQETRMTISGEILESRGQVRPTEVNGGSVGHTDRYVGDGEHGGVGEATREGDHLLGGRRQDPCHLPDQRGLAGGGHCADESGIHRGSSMSQRRLFCVTMAS